jgi:ribonuclease HI
MKRATLYTDGGARGNPGPAGIGVVLAVGKKEPMKISTYIGEATNNVAEYTALVTGMKLAHNHGVTHLQCFLDSELVVKQLNGDYKGMKPLHAEASELRDEFVHVTFSHVERGKNKDADALVNEALDEAAKK